MKNYLLINLHLFDGEGGAEGAAAPLPGAGSKAGKSSNPLANVQYGAKPQSAPEGQDTPTSAQAGPGTTVTSNVDAARKAEFDKLIKGDYKDLYDASVQRNINARFKEMDSLRTKSERLDALDPILTMLAQKYGVDGTDADALAKAIEDDDSYYEEEALAKGLTVEQLKNIKKLERENESFRRAAQEQQRRQNADRIYALWQQQSEECKLAYPNFDLQREVDPQQSPTAERFLSLLKSGVDVKTAYTVIHMDDIMSGAMQYTAQQISQKTVNDIMARGIRPAENGAKSTGATTVVKTDPTKFTKKDREEISRRVARGEIITL